MIVLVDTSVWIMVLAGREPFAKKLSWLLVNAQVVGHELVYGELLIGDPGGRVKFLADYARRDFLPMAPHEDVVELVRRRKLHGRGAGWIDSHLLAATLVGNARFWTADIRLDALAHELGIAYDVSK